MLPDHRHYSKIIQCNYECFRVSLKGEDPEETENFRRFKLQQKTAPTGGLYTRTLEKHGHKMKSYVAVQKKLLVLIYAIWKSNKPYQVNYEKNRHTGEKEQEPSSLHGLAQAGIENESSAKPEGGATQGRHTVETSQCASSLQLQIYH